jgi:hypothetical protein
MKVQQAWIACRLSLGVLVSFARDTSTESVTRVTWLTLGKIRKWLILSGRKINPGRINDGKQAFSISK